MSKLLDLTDDSERLKRVEDKIDLIISLLKADPTPNTIEWNGQDLELEGGKDYYIPSHITPKIEGQKVTISTKGTGRANLFFGVEGMSKWSGNHSRDLFSIGEDVEVTIKNVNLYTIKVANEVDPFYHRIFHGMGKNQKMNLINVDTNMSLGLLYSASQDITQVITQENVTFKGFQYQELKANNGGGLKSVIRGVKLTQINPPHYFMAALKFSRELVDSSVPFSAIENGFHSGQKANACNIIYAKGMTFCLPWGLQLGNSHPIRKIPNVGESITLNQGSNFLQSNEWELQAGDILEVDSKEYTIQSKDRPAYPEFQDSGYAIDYNIGVKLSGNVSAVVKKSQGLSIIGKEVDGYMIFKDNKNFQTNVKGNFDLDYYLKSNPIGVLSYNHEEITVDWKDLEHNGFYRQSRSGVGKSNGYELDNVKITEGQFKIPSYLPQSNESSR